MLVAVLTLLGTEPITRAVYPSADIRLERRLTGYINEEREANGLPPVAVSSALTQVARAHVRDLMRNQPDTGYDQRGRRCTMHSWSDAGDWTPVCFTADNAYARWMWSKPREITHGVYSGDGVEVAYRMGGGVTPEVAIDGWLHSPAHASVIMEEGVWRSSDWQAMGVAVYGDYAVAWFGKLPDGGGTASRRGN